MPVNPDPVAVLEAGLDQFAAGDLGGWLDRCSDNVLFEFPFAPDGRPRSVQGRDALADYLQHLPGSVAVRRIRSRRVYRTDDPGVVIVEMTVRGTQRKDGITMVQDSSFIAVVIVADGKIERYRDYWNPTGGRPVPAEDAA